MEADVTKNTKTRKRTEVADGAERLTNEDKSSADVDPDPIYLVSFGGDSTEPPALPSTRDYALVDNSAAAPKSCLSSTEMSMRTSTGGLLPAVTASTVTRNTFDQPPLWFWPTEEINLRTSNQYATDYSNFRKMKICKRY